MAEKPPRKKRTTSKRSRETDGRKDGSDTDLRGLQQALQVAGAAAELRRNDHLNLLEAIVSTAVRVIGATAGSMMLLDPEANELVFQVAVGPGAEEIKQFRVPLGQGVAGFTASTGQAMAIADTSKDTRFARQIAEGSGYVPKNLLSVPLMLRGEVIGVMQLLDKSGGTTPFTPADTAVLSSFGDQAALAIDLSLQSQSLQRMLAAAANADGDADLAGTIARAVADAGGTAEHRRTLTLAAQVATICAVGERETALCADILSAVSRFLQSGGSGGSFGLGDFGGGIF
jgi:GAF domain-containing protein